MEETQAPWSPTDHRIGISPGMLRRLGRNDEAAIARTNDLTEREYMQPRLDGLAFA